MLQTRLKSLSSMDTAVLDEKEVICWQSDNSVRYVEIDRVTTVWWSSSTTYNVQNCAPEPKQIKLKTKLTKARRIQLCLRLETQIKLKERRIQTNSKPETTNQIKVVHLFLNNAFITRFERDYSFRIYMYLISLVLYIKTYYSRCFISNFSRPKQRWVFSYYVIFPIYII